MQPDITWRNWLMVAALGLIWGSSFMVVEVALREFRFLACSVSVTFGHSNSLGVDVIRQAFFPDGQNRMAQHRGHWCAQLGPPLFIA